MTTTETNPASPQRAVRTYLQMTDRARLQPRTLDDEGVRVDRVERCVPALWRSLYAEVGAAYRWVDRLPWTDGQITEYLSDPAITLHVLTVDGEVAGYFELRAQDDDSVEIAYFGLRPAFYGRGLGAHMLTEAARRAWDLRPSRVWLHTSTLDHAAALPNYRARGFVVFKREEYDAPQSVSGTPI